MISWLLSWGSWPRRFRIAPRGIRVSPTPNRIASVFIGAADIEKEGHLPGIELALDCDSGNALEPSFQLVLHDMRGGDEVVDGEGEGRRIGEVDVHEALDTQTALDRECPLGDLLGDVSGTNDLGSQ